eukprot:NODE_115_length_18417_cov_0.666012.p10 type:complete len:266 gc:universal NODE_115_length_18417_cov_0.666012:5870-5073(-)
MLHRRIFKVHGKDAHNFLTSLCSNNLNSSINYLLFLTPQSRVITDAFYYKSHSSNYLEVPEMVSESLISHILKYKLRSDILLESVHGEVDWYHTKPNNLNGELFKDPRPLMGYRSLNIRKTAPTVTADAQTYTVYRYQNGIPEASDFPKSIPFDMNFDLLNAIDFHKGCYTGQELIIRTKHTGVVRKRTISFKIKDVDHTKVPKLHGQNIVIQGKSVGKILNYVRSGKNIYGLATIRLDKFEHDASVNELNLELKIPDYIRHVIK